MEQRKRPDLGDLGRFGEMVATWYLSRAGCVPIGRNVRSGYDEIDLLVRDGRQCVAVEVKCAGNGDDPLLAVDAAKFARIERGVAGMALSVARIDLVSVAVGDPGVAIRWLRGVR